MLADDAAAAALVREHLPGMWRASYAICGRADIADDAVQEAFERALRYAHRFDPARPLGPWLHRIVVNRTRSLSAERARRADEELFDEHADPGAGPEQSAEVRAALGALAGLPFDQREAIVLRHVFGYGAEEAASILGVPPGTIRARCSRGLARLRERLGAS